VGIGAAAPRGRVARHAAADRALHAEHDALIARAGAGELVRASGWMEAFRTPSAFERAVADAGLTARRHGLGIKPLDAAALRAKEPSLAAGFCGALHWLDPKSVVDPSALVKSYAQLFVQGGGTLLTGDAASVDALSPGWQVMTDQARSPRRRWSSRSARGPIRCSASSATRSRCARSAAITCTTRHRSAARRRRRSSIANTAT
jgi:glycine/D-amino acid oxidase-like deaminating enzyme